MKNLEALARIAGPLRERIQADREQTLATLRAMVPGFTGRLEGPRLFVTEAEAQLLRDRVPMVARLADDQLAAIDVVLEEEA